MVGPAHTGPMLCGVCVSATTRDDCLSILLLLCHGQEDSHGDEGLQSYTATMLVRTKGCLSDALSSPALTRLRRA